MEIARDFTIRETQIYKSLQTGFGLMAKGRDMFAELARQFLASQLMPEGRNDEILFQLSQMDTVTIIHV